MFIAVLMFGLVSSPLRAAEPPVTAVCFSPDQKQLIVGSQAGVQVLDRPSRKLSRRLETKLRHVHAIAFNAKGDRLLLAGGAPAERGAVQLLTWPQCKPVYHATLHHDLIHDVAWNTKGTQFLTASADHTVHVIDAKTGKPVRTFTGHSEAVLAVGLLNDGKTAVSVGVDQVLHVWDVSEGKPIRRRHNHTDTITCVALKPGDAPLPMIATGSLDRTVRFWQPTIGRLVKFVRLPSAVLCLTWSSDGHTLFVGCRDGGLYEIDAQRLKHSRKVLVKNGWIYSVDAGELAGVVVGASNGVIKSWRNAKP